MLALPMHANYGMVTGDLEGLEGCYLYFDQCKYKWNLSGKTPGDGPDACFRGRVKKHRDNSRLIDQMRVYRLYSAYPACGVPHLGATEGNFDDLAMHCGMTYDKKADVTSLMSTGDSRNLLVWTSETINALKGYGAKLKKLQLDEVTYLWELCYDLLLEEADNLSVSPGFESLGLRINRKLKREDEQV